MRIFNKFLVAIVIFLAGNFGLHAQEAPGTNNYGDGEHLSATDIYNPKQTMVISDTLKGWDYNWTGALNGSQAAYSNWSQGGVNTISLTAATLFNALYRKGRYGYGVQTNLKYGKTHIAGEDTRKTDDLILIGNKFTYQFPDKRWIAFGKMDFTTQFDKGFDYGGDEPVLISKFFAPAYLTETAGIGFLPTSYFTVEAGLGFKQTFVSEDSLSTRYGLNTGDNFRFEPGFSIMLGFEKKILKNVTLTSSLGTFTNLQRSVDRTDVSFTTALIGKINNYLNMSFQFATIYDDDFNKQLQVKQVLSAGVSVSIF